MNPVASYRSSIEREVVTNLAMLQAARQKKESALAKIQDAQAMMQNAQAKIQSGQAKIQEAQAERAAVFAERERKCKIIHERLNFIISQLNVEKTNLEAIRKGPERDKLIGDLATLILKANQLDGEAVPTVSLQNVIAKFGTIGNECGALSVRIETFKAQLFSSISETINFVIDSLNTQKGDIENIVDRNDRQTLTLSISKIILQANTLKTKAQSTNSLESIVPQFYDLEGGFNTLNTRIESIRSQNALMLEKNKLTQGRDSSSGLFDFSELYIQEIDFSEFELQGFDDEELCKSLQ